MLLCNAPKGDAGKRDKGCCAMLPKVMQARVTKATARTASKAANTTLIPPCASWKICHMCLPNTVPIGFDCKYNVHVIYHMQYNDCYHHHHYSYV